MSEQPRVLHEWTDGIGGQHRIVDYLSGPRHEYKAGDEWHRARSVYASSVLAMEILRLREALQVARDLSTGELGGGD